MSDESDDSIKEEIKSQRIFESIKSMNIDQIPEPIFTPEIVQEFTKSEQLDLLCYPRLTEWLWQTILYHDKILAMSPHIIFILLQELLLTENIEIYHVIRKYSSNFPDSCIDFEPFLLLVLESGISAPSITPYMLCCCRRSIFYATESFNENQMLMILMKICILIYFHFKAELPEDFVEYFNENLEVCQYESTVLITELSQLIDNSIHPKCVYNYYNIYHNLNFRTKTGYFLHDWLSRKYIANLLECQEFKSCNDFISNFHIYLDTIKSLCRSNQKQNLKTAIIASLLIEKYAIAIYVNNDKSHDVEQEKLNAFMKDLIYSFQFNWLRGSQIEAPREREIIKEISNRLQLLIE